MCDSHDPEPLRLSPPWQFSLIQQSNLLVTHFTHFQSSLNPQSLVDPILQLKGQTFTATGDPQSGVSDPAASHPLLPVASSHGSVLPFSEAGGLWKGVWGRQAESSLACLCALALGLLAVGC